MPTLQLHGFRRFALLNVTAEFHVWIIFLEITSTADECVAQVCTRDLKKEGLFFYL